jgi:hypothetical protein
MAMMTCMQLVSLVSTTSCWHDTAASASAILLQQAAGHHGLQQDLQHTLWGVTIAFGEFAEEKLKTKNQPTTFRKLGHQQVPSPRTGLK